METLFCIITAIVTMWVLGFIGFIVTLKHDHEEIKLTGVTLLAAPLGIFLWTYLFARWLGFAKDHMDASDFTNAKIEPKLKRTLKNFNNWVEHG